MLGLLCLLSLGVARVFFRCQNATICPENYIVHRNASDQTASVGCNSCLHVIVHFNTRDRRFISGYHLDRLSSLLSPLLRASCDDCYMTFACPVCQDCCCFFDPVEKRFCHFNPRTKHHSARPPTAASRIPKRQQTLFALQQDIQITM
ncbi:hypothetical protein KCU64_g17, partial [Aureobasidium melanogenum]